MIESNMTDLEPQIQAVKVPFHEPPQNFFEFNHTAQIYDENKDLRYMYGLFGGNTGGMAKVYKGWDVKLGIPVAIKIRKHITPEEIVQNSLGKEDILKRHEAIAKEANLLASLDHPHIIKVLDLTPLEDKNQFAYIMRYFNPSTSPSLKQFEFEAEVVKDDKYISNIGKVATDIGSAIDYLSGIEYVDTNGKRIKGIFHNDIKPGNIILDPHYGALLIDFGIASPNSVSENPDFIPGTAGFVSPEIMSQGLAAIDQESNVYSLALTLFTTLTGDWAFGSRKIGTYIESYQASTSGNYNKENLLKSTPEKYHKALIKFFNKAFDPDKYSRFQTGSQLSEAFLKALS